MQLDEYELVRPELNELRGKMRTSGSRRAWEVDIDGYYHPAADGIILRRPEQWNSNDGGGGGASGDGDRRQSWEQDATRRAYALVVFRDMGKFRHTMPSRAALSEQFRRSSHTLLLSTQTPAVYKHKIQDRRAQRGCALQYNYTHRLVHNVQQSNTRNYAATGVEFLPPACRHGL